MLTNKLILLKDDSCAAFVYSRFTILSGQKTDFSLNGEVNTPYRANASWRAPVVLMNDNTSLENVTAKLDYIHFFLAPVLGIYRENKCLCVKCG